MRRRRVLLESTSMAEPDDRQPSSRRRQRRTYADEALKENQLRLCDLIPKAWWTILLFLLVPCGMLFGIAQGYLHFHQQEDIVAATFALNGSGNLASWFASLLLLLAGVGSLQVYLLRRHKLDDYRGRYKVWLVVAGWCAIASLDASSGLHRLLELAARRMPTAGIFSSADGWWLLIAAVLSGILGLRLVVEMRRTIPSLVFMSLALIGYGSLLAQQLGWVVFPATIDTSLLSAMILLGSHVAVSMSIWMYARYCFFSAQRFGRRRRQDSAHLEAGPHQARESRSRQVEELDEEDAWEDEEEEEELPVAGDDEENLEDDMFEEEKEIVQEEEEEEEEASYSRRSSYHYYQQEEQHDDSDDDSDDDSFSGLTSEERQLLDGVDEETRVQESADEREREISEMQAADQQYGEGMDPQRWRKMSKRERKKWRRRQRRAA
jgi:hypothetical protein